MNFNFTVEEMNLLSAFDAGNRTETMEQMEDMAMQLNALVYRLRNMTDEAYHNLEIVVTDTQEDTAP